MRNRFNRNAVCSSDNYGASKRAHLQMLQERHSHFSGIAISGEIKIDVPQVTPRGELKPRFKTITIFGKQMTLTIEEYDTYYAKCKF